MDPAAGKIEIGAKGRTAPHISPSCRSLCTSLKTIRQMILSCVRMSVNQKAVKFAIASNGPKAVPPVRSLDAGRDRISIFNEVSPSMLLSYTPRMNRI